jgi:cobalt-precorrin 5A hydrolase
MSGLAVITFSPEGLALAKRLRRALPACRVYAHAEAPRARGVRRFRKVMELTAALFAEVDGIVVIGPSGIAVRAVAGCLRHKLSDPAVVVVDAGGRFAVSLLSGHEGGANRLAIDVANALGAEPVISTTTEAVKTVTVGVGCRRGTAAARIATAVRKGLKRARVNLREVRWLATAEIKRREPGLIEAASRLGLPLRVIPDWMMKRAGDEVTPSEFVKAKTGLPAVAEPAALTSGRNTRLLLKRQVIDGVTVAVARERCG